jgi:hypothetical protein
MATSAGIVVSSFLSSTLAISEPSKKFNQDKLTYKTWMDGTKVWQKNGKLYMLEYVNGTKIRYYSKFITSTEYPDGSRFWFYENNVFKACGPNGRVGSVTRTENLKFFNNDTDELVIPPLAMLRPEQRTLRNLSLISGQDLTI